tara:strand:- start:707 stop:931 length:225 start_codon:yes stop_codon:yes gene_type:complete
MKINVITAYIGDKEETPKEGYGFTEPKQKGYTSGSQLFDERCMEYKREQPRSNNEARANGRMVRSGMTVSGWGF